jgi:starch-binding outer membrane protein, SusD/RagB family
MFMKTKKIFSCLLALFILTFACSKKDLDVDSTRQLASTYYKTDDQVMKGLEAAYNPMTNTGDANGWGTSLVIWGSVASEDAYSGGGGPTDQPGYQSADTYIASPSDPGVNLRYFWSNYFQGINRSNILITNVKPDDAFKKNAIAQAQFLKAFYYFYASRMWGGLPLMPTVPFPQDKFKRSTLDETYTFIEDLLITAINSGDLQVRSGGIDPANGFATKGSAQALLGKVYMYHAAIDPKYYASAIPYLKAVADDDLNYKLDPAFWHIFSPTNRHGVESIFEINFTSQNGAYGNADSRLCGVRTIATQRINDTIDYGWGFNQPSQNLINAFNDQNDKIRMNATAFNADTVRVWHKAFRADSLQYQFNVDGYWDRKHYINPHAAGGTWRTAANPQIVLRVGDIYLLLAEAYFQTGDAGSAATYVNKVRRRVALADKASVTLDDIKLERRLETALEGDRYWDLLRWGDAEKILGDLGYSAGTPGVKTHGLFPIPQEEIDRTKGSLLQNDGY